MSIRKKAQFLAFLPLISSCVFILSLSSLLLDLGRAVDLERSTRAEIAETNSIFSEFYSCLGYYANWILFNDQAHKEPLVNSLSKMNTLAASLRASPAADRDTANRHQRVASAVVQFRILLEGLIAKHKPGPLNPMEMAMIRARSLRIFQPALADIDQILVVKHAYLQTLRQSAETKLHVIISVVVFGVILNILITIVLLRLFVKDLTHRIKLLAENAFRLPAAAPLISSPGRAANQLAFADTGAGDELTTLENSFQKMAADLDRSARARQEYLAMISHDLRTPLASLTGTLATTARGLYGVLSAEGLKLARKEEKEMLRLSILVNDLLTLEQIEADRLNISEETIELGEAILRLEENANQTYGNNLAVLEALVFKPLGEKRIHIKTDADKLDLVLSRLIEAAVQDCNPDESITIAVSNMTHRATIAVSYSSSGIRPPRKGLFARYLQAEFAPRSDRAADPLEDFRISLCLCRTLAEKLGGELILLSDREKQCFELTLPVDSTTEAKS
ncbi:MAG: HAMP domain-containing histidine kinase [Cyanobacteria bacterium SZAS LIN-2]|nr:HAMP domain-containing histidine kinase [Cyanobacteria bacterium SZAS LIN-3]MBS1995119.1 HAMP domain-containing histidine kinase [Cyanobacteria bacterium SZAS LIN-2]